MGAANVKRESWSYLIDIPENDVTDISVFSLHKEKKCHRKSEQEKTNLALGTYSFSRISHITSCMSQAFIDLLHLVPQPQSDPL